MTKTKAQLRAEAVERLKQLDEFGGGSFEYAILGGDKMTWSYMDKRDALIDLLTDDEIPDGDSEKRVELRELVCNGLREQRDRWLNIAVGVYRRFYPHGEYGVPDDPTDMINDAIDAIEHERDEWKAKAEGYAEALEKAGCSVLDNGTVFISESDASKERTEHESLDTREKLEDEIRSMRKRSSIDFYHSDVWVEAPIGVVLKWLDRQAAIKERELIENARSDCDICGNDFRRQRDEMQDERDELQREVDRLTRENVNLAHDLGECMAEHETLAPVDMDDNETANDVCPDVLEQPSDDQPEDGEATETDAAKGDTHDFDDTREKVEADMRKILHDAYMLAWEHGRENRRGSSFERVLVDVEFYKLLDRQASITEHTAGIAAKEASKVLRETIADLREEVAERDDVIAVLKAENEELRKALGK